ncbi:MAG TPA: 2-oxoacid:acceptor oxidoreductase subunit alpha, partial [Candidatus Binatia bacterium]|nr:2-oxoacid:acceptor oxidoreductase subunit alpha [Candidatus Binatia bacterium]
GHDEEGRYTEGSEAYSRNMDRLARKEETARGLVPDPLLEASGTSSDVGLIAFGTTHHAIVEARDVLGERGISFDYLRVRALPLSPAVVDFVAEHERIYVVEQNRDGQLYDLVRLALPPHLVERVRSIRHYDGRPIPAEAITRPLLELEAIPA